MSEFTKSEVRLSVEVSPAHGRPVLTKHDERLGYVEKSFSESPVLTTDRGLSYAIGFTRRNGYVARSASGKRLGGGLFPTKREALQAVLDNANRSAR